MALLRHAGFLVFPQWLSLALFAVASAFWFGPELVNGQMDATREYQIKAAFLYNFVQFVKWPETAFSDPKAPFRIVVLGNDPFGSTLDDTFKGETMNGHRFEVMRGDSQALTGCQMVFVSRTLQRNIDSVLSQLKTRPVLTVSEIEGFAEQGGDINFYLSGSKIRFEINQQSAERVGLKISSQLLSLGKVVKP